MQVKSFYLIILIAIFFNSCQTKLKKDNKQSIEISIYKDNCSICHGDDGKKQVSGAKDLSVSTLSDELVKQAIINGNPNAGMPAYGNRLSPSEIDSLVSFVIRLRTQ